MIKLIVETVVVRNRIVKGTDRTSKKRTWLMRIIRSYVQIKGSGIKGLYRASKSYLT